MKIQTVDREMRVTVLLGKFTAFGSRAIRDFARSPVLIVSLFANASDYSNKTCIFCKIQAHIPVYTSLVGVVTCVGDSVGEERYD